MSDETLSDWRSRIAHDGGPPRLLSGPLVAEILSDLAATGGVEGVLARRPGLTAEDVRACLLCAAETLRGLPVEQAVTLPPAAPAGQAVTIAHAPTAAADTLGEGRIVVPGYEILGEIGRGGMGVVYKARHVRLDRVVALKMVLSGEHAGAAERARFQREAEAVARLQHPGIVQIYEAGEHGGHSYVALEFVSGGSLASQLTREPMDADEAAALVEKLARAIHFAHQRGVIHRDLKPENVLLTEDGEPKVTDFGLAKKLEEVGQTKTGEVMGTPSYMAPEQAAGRKDVGPAADVYALGGVLHRLLSGRPPFTGATTLDVMLAVLEEEPTPLRQLNPSAPRDLETIVLNCLRKEPAKRYATAADVADELRRYREGEAILGRRASLLERSWRLVRRNPGRVASWLFVGLVLSMYAFFPLLLGSGAGIGALGAVVLLTLAFLRARWRTMGAGALVGLGLSAALGVLFVLGPPVVGDAFAVLFGLPEGEVPLGPEPVERSQIVPFALVPALALLPVFVGIVVGAAFRERWAHLLAGVALLLVCAAVGFPFCLFTVLGAAGLTVLFASIAKLVSMRTGGAPFDALLGTIFGGFLGMTFGSCVSLPCIALPVGAGAGDFAVVQAVLTGLGFFGGAFPGAWLASRPGRKKEQG